MSEQDARKIFARNLTGMMELADMNQSDLAERLGVSKTAVSSWCSGLKAPRMDKVDAMAKIFGVTRASFYEEQPPELVVVDARCDQLRKMFYQLNDAGQAKLMDYAVDLLNHPNYKQSEQ